MFVWLSCRRGRILDHVTGPVPHTVIGAIAVTVSCVAGFALSFSGFKLRETVSASSFTFIGVVCKFATVLANQLIWVHHGSPLGALVLCGSIVLSTIYVAPRQIDASHATAKAVSSRAEGSGAVEDDDDDHDIADERSYLVRGHRDESTRCTAKLQEC